MTPSGGYVGCVDADGRVVMTLHSGYLEFKRELAPADLPTCRPADLPDLDWPGPTLSTFSPRVSPDRRMLTRQLALDWNPDWSHTDLRIIEENLTRLAAQTRRRPFLRRAPTRRTSFYTPAIGQAFG